MFERVVQSSTEGDINCYRVSAIDSDCGNRFLPRKCRAACDDEIKSRNSEFSKKQIPMVTCDV